MNTRNQDESNREPGFHIDLNLGGLFKGLKNIVNQVSDMVEKGEQFRTQEQAFRGKGSLKDLHGVYGFSIKMGLGGEPVVETFGNVKETDEGPIVEETREPLTDIIEEDGEIQVIAEMPGVTEEEIFLEVKGDVLVLEAGGEKRTYKKEVLLPAEVNAPPTSQTFTNGILEIRLQKT